MNKILKNWKYTKKKDNLFLFVRNDKHLYMYLYFFSISCNINNIDLLVYFSAKFINLITEIWVVTEPIIL